MEKVGVRQLKIHASEIVRRVQEDHESFEITYRGEPIGRIVPVLEAASQSTLSRSWEEWEAYFDETSKHVEDRKTLEETMNEIRRTL
jgi:prevent-host-death family protein